MLIKDDSALLGDKYLNETEGLAKIKEENQKTTDQSRIPDQEILEDKKAAVGLTMDPSELINRIQRLNPRILVELGGVKNAVAIRYAKKNAETGKDEKAYVTGFYIDHPLLEFSYVLVDDKGLPVREMRGWRSVLLALVRQKLLTLKQIELTFGKANGQRAILWDKQTQAERI